MNLIETSEAVIEKEEKIKQKNNFMSAEQEESFLKQFEKIMTETLSTNKIKEPT